MAGRDTPATTAARKAGIEHHVHEYEHYVSAGRRGLEIELAPGDLVALTQATVRRLRR